MQTTINYPRWLSIPMLIIAVLFMGYWAYIAFKSGNYFFTLIGVLIGLVIIAQAIYTVVTGKLPQVFKTKP